jgi:hypothetical protein
MTDWIFVSSAADVFPVALDGKMVLNIIFVLRKSSLDFRFHYRIYYPKLTLWPYR